MSDELVTEQEAAAAEIPFPASNTRTPAWRKLRRPKDAIEAVRSLATRLLDQADRREEIDPGEVAKMADVFIKLHTLQLDQREAEVEEREEAVRGRENACMKVMREMDEMMAEERRG